MTYRLATKLLQLNIKLIRFSVSLVMTHVFISTGFLFSKIFLKCRPLTNPILKFDSLLKLTRRVVVEHGTYDKQFLEDKKKKIEDWLSSLIRNSKDRNQSNSFLFSIVHLRAGKKNTKRRRCLKLACALSHLRNSQSTTFDYYDITRIFLSLI